MINENENYDNREVDRAAEKSIISCMLQDQDTVDIVNGTIDGVEFDSEVYRKFFNAIITLFKEGKTPNVIQVRDYLISKGENGDIVDMEFLKDLATYVTNPKEVKTFVNIVREKYILRMILATCNNINLEVSRGVHYDKKSKKYIESDMSCEDILDSAQQQFYKLSEEKGQKNYIRAQKIVSDVMYKIGESAKSKDGITGIKSGIRQLDEWTAGFQNSNLIILAARPGVGKTAFALNIANYAIKDGCNAAFFSLEMSKEELVMRLLSMQSNISSSKLRSGNKLNSKDWDDLYTASGNIPNLIIDDTSNITIAQLRSKCRKIKREEGLDIVFIDYLQLMHAGDVASDTKYAKYINNRQEEVAEISRSLKGLAKELNIPIVALAQTRRPSAEQSDKKDNMPQLEDLKESGSIEQDADLVLFLHKPKKAENDNEDSDEIYVRIAKHRNGKIGTIKLRFNGATMKYYELNSHDNELLAGAINTNEAVD